MGESWSAGGGPLTALDFRPRPGWPWTSTDTVFLVTFMGQRVYELSAQGDVIRYLDGGETAGPHVAARAEIPGMSELFGDARPGHAGMGATGLGDPHGLYAFPSDVAVAPDGTIYVSNTHAYELLVFEPSGTLRAAWGTKGVGTGAMGSAGRTDSRPAGPRVRRRQRELPHSGDGPRRNTATGLSRR